MSEAHRIFLLESELRDREFEIALLKETAVAVSSEPDLEKVLQLVADHARKLILAETVLIPILNEECTEYTYRAGCGRNAEEVVGQSLPLEVGVCGWVWRNRRPWWHGVLAELDEAERNRWEKEAGNVILVPLAGKRQFLGGLAGINKIGGRDFSKRDLDLLMFFADQASSAIDNATSFGQLCKTRAQLAQSRHELQELDADLERRVEQRTAELADAVKQLERLILQDPLTELPNRTLLQDRLRQGILTAQRANKSSALIMIDLDGFQQVNDHYGHDVGDRLLKEVAVRLTGSLRRSDTVGRLGNDEFAVVLPFTGITGATRAASKLLDVLKQPFQLEGCAISVTGSLGIAAYPDHAPDVSALCKCADAAMYVAKRRHSGSFIYHAAECAQFGTVQS
ncbi:MAG TPA: diguanylate cyclase [Candidatus Methylomirabilis sp.]|nr:diguanylate cyclase [Candidatus Methylomirabilis sp.]